MRIGINARYIQKQATGIENYLSNTLVNLMKIDKANEYVLFFGNDRPLPAYLPKDNFLVDVPGWKTDSQFKRLLWEHLYLPGAIKKHKLDIFHEPSFIAPIFKKCPTIITVFDLAFIYHPECFTRRNILYFKTMLKKSIKNADFIIAISNSTKNDIINCFGVNPDKIKVIYCGVNEYFGQHERTGASAETLKKYGIRGDFILNVSLISPRKNLVNLIQSFKLLLDRKKIDCQLVIAGAKGWLYEDIFRKVDELTLADRVIFTGYVSDEELRHLYDNAKVFAYPSVYEGFGLPVLEAMSCGCPVVASNTSSLPEICGDSAVLVNPSDIESIAEGIRKIVSDPQTSGNLAKKGKERARQFTWEKSSRETLALYKQLNEQSKAE